MIPEARDVNPIPGCLSPYEEIRLIADELGLDIHELVAKRRVRIQEEAAEEERIRTAKIQADAARKRAKNKANFERFIRDQGVIVLFDGKPLLPRSPVVWCKDGELSETGLQKACDITATARGRLSNGRIGQSPGTLQAAEASIDVPCTCEKGSHRIRVFISGEK